jgi:hypothetical protein
MKNFSQGLEWIWSKDKFLNRKADMIEMLLDFQDDGTVNRDKFKVTINTCIKEKVNITIFDQKIELRSVLGISGHANSNGHASNQPEGHRVHDAIQSRRQSDRSEGPSGWRNQR